MKSSFDLACTRTASGLCPVTLGNSLFVCISSQVSNRYYCTVIAYHLVVLLVIIFTLLAISLMSRNNSAWQNQYGCVVHALDHCMVPSPSHHYVSHYACMVNPGYTSRTFFHSVSNFLGFKLFYFLYTTIAVRFTILVVMSAMVARSAIVVRSVFLQNIIICYLLIG